MPRLTPDELAELKQKALENWRRLVAPVSARYELHKRLFGSKGLPLIKYILPRLARRRLRKLRGERESRAFQTRFERANITEEYWLRLVAALGGRCGYCCAPCEKLTIDHILAYARGGQGGEGGVIPACGSCNSRKQHRSLEWLLAKMSINRDEFDARFAAACREAASGGETDQADSGTDRRTL